MKDIVPQSYHSLMLITSSGGRTNVDPHPAIYFSICRSIVHGNKVPLKKDANGIEMPKDLSEYTRDDDLLCTLNEKAIDILYFSLAPDQFNLMSSCDSAHD